MVAKITPLEVRTCQPPSANGRTAPITLSKTKTDFNIPHDLNILNKIFNIKNGKYISKNDYWKSYSIIKEINKINIKDREKMNIKIHKINKEYENLSKLYQKNKKNNLIPLN